MSDMTKPDFFNLHARVKLNLSDDWEWFHLENVDSPYGHYFRIRGAVAPPFKSGPRKGRPNFAKRDPTTERILDIVPAEHDAFVAAWERETGKCSGCNGTGQAIHGWSRDDGLKYHPCRKCGATGKAATAKEALCP